MTSDQTIANVCLVFELAFGFPPERSGVDGGGVYATTSAAPVDPRIESPAVVLVGTDVVFFGLHPCHPVRAIIAKMRAKQELSL